MEPIKIAFVWWFLLSFIILGKGMFKRKRYLDAKNNYIYVQGYIAEVKKGVRRSYSKYRLVFSYTVNNVVYKVSKLSKRNEQQCGIYYNPTNPSDAVAEGDIDGNFELIAGGSILLFLVACVIKVYIFNV